MGNSHVTPKTRQTTDKPDLSDIRWVTIVGTNLFMFFNRDIVWGCFKVALSTLIIMNSWIHILGKDSQSVNSQVLNEALLYTLGLTDSQERLQAVTEAFQAGHVSRSDGGDVCGTCVNFTNQKNMRITHHRVTGIIFGFGSYMMQIMRLHSNMRISVSTNICWH